MSGTWEVQEAKTRFSEFLQKSLSEGPQIVTRRGVETAVLVPIGQWRRMQRVRQTNIKEWLLAPTLRTETLAPPRSELPSRPPPKLG